MHKSMKMHQNQNVLTQGVTGGPGLSLSPNVVQARCDELQHGHAPCFMRGL